MPQHEISFLLTLDIGMALSGILITAISCWALMRQSIQSTREITQITREVAFMIRRQYGDIDRDLQEIKELLGGQ